MQSINAICDIYKLDIIAQLPISVCPNRLWQIKTEQGLFAIKQVPNGFLASHYILQGEEIGKAFANSGIKAITAIPCAKDIICKVNARKFLVFKWCDGCVLSSEAVAPYHAYHVGKLLARLHLINLNLPNIFSSRWQKFYASDGQELSRILQHERAVALINHSLLPKLNCWLEQYFIAQTNLKGAYVISHGDLLQGNVIWDKDNSPCLIDWEAAGWIHPQIELVGVLLNWSGINVGDLKYESFINILQGYCSAGGELNINENILWASLGSWFAWLFFNLRQLIFAEKAVEAEIIHTARTLQHCIEIFPVLLNWINNQ